MTKPPRTILIVDDIGESSEEYKQQLNQDADLAYQISIEPYNSQTFASCYSQQLDGLLFDLDSPHADALNFLSQLKEHLGENCPPIVVVGSDDTEVAVRAFKNGATDYLIRDRISPNDLRLAMRRAIENAQLKRELQRDRARFQISVENMMDCFGIFSSLRDDSGQIVDFRIDYLNEAACENNCMTKEMQLGRGLCEVLPNHRESGLFDKYCRLVETGEPLIEESLVYEDTYGEQRLVRAFDIRATKFEDGFVASWRDVSSRKRLELELKQTVTQLCQEQNRLQRLINTAPIGIGIGSVNGEVKMINDAMLRLHGLTREEFERGGMNWRQFIPPEEVDRTELEMAQFQEQGFVPSREKVLLRRDGTRVPVWISGIRWLEGTDDHVSYAMDLTQLKQTEAALREAQIQLEVALAAGSIYTWRYDIPKNLVFTDRNFAQLFGIDTVDVTHGLPIEQFLQRIHPDDRERVTAEIENAIATGEDYKTEYRVRSVEGRERWVLARGRVKYDPNGNPVALPGALADITERKETEAALRESEERFRTLADNMSQFAWMADATGWIFWYNRRWFEYTGTTLEQMQGWGWQQVHHPDHVERVMKKISRCYETGELWEDTFPLRSQEGEYRWFLSRALPIRDEAGKIVCWFGTNTDITEQKRAEAALRQSEDRLRMAIESAQLGTWDWNLVTERLTWDRGCKAMFGLSTDVEVTIETFYAGLHPEDRARLEKVVRASLAPEGDGNYDTEYRTIGIEDGIERWIAAKGKVYFDSKGMPLRFVGTVLNITEQKQAQALRERLLKRERAAREEAERANRLKDQFLAILSHELRTPLNPILGWANLLQTRKFSETKINIALATIERNARLQSQLIDDLLDVARILRGKLVINQKPTDLAQVIENALDTVRTAAETKSISLEVDLPSIGLVSGDAARLQQIFSNLLTNAIKFTPQGGRVEVCLKRVENQARVIVTDTGKGISAEFLPQVFESFRQQDASTTRQFGGLGLGLAIVRYLVKAHQGTITAHSPGEGKGATFTVSLPLLNLQPDNHQEKETRGSVLDLTGVRVLAVDDQLDAREVLAASLTHYGAEVRVAASATEALEIFEVFQPNVLVSDIGMPEVDGYSLIEQIRAFPPEKGGAVNAIALTAYATEANCQQALASGYQAHIAKPLEPEALVQVVAKLA